MMVLRITIGFLLLGVANYSNAAWSPYYEIASNYFHPIGTSDQVIILNFSTSFHTCGWDTAAELKASQVGQEFFEVASSVILAAVLADRKVSLLTSDDPNEYCNGSRAGILGIRIAH